MTSRSFITVTGLLTVAPAILVMGQNTPSPQDIEARYKDYFKEEILITVQAGILKIFPTATGVYQDRWRMASADRRRIEREADVSFPYRQVEVWMVFGRVLQNRYPGDERPTVAPEGHLVQDTFLGYAVVTNEVGKFKPISFLVGITPQGRVSDTRVLVYRETRGEEVVRSRFLNQFKGKTVYDPVSPLRDMINITGATYSVNALCRSVREALAVVDTLYLSKNSSGAYLINPVKTEIPVRNLDRDEETFLKKTGVYQPLMGTLFHVWIDPPGNVSPLKSKPQGLSQKAFSILRRWEDILSLYRPTSELSRLNTQLSQAQEATLSPELTDFLSLARNLSQKTQGAFDATTLPLSKLWGFHDRSYRVPDPREIQNALKKVGYEKYTIFPQEKKLKTSVLGVQFDPGALGKGWAIDEAVRVLKTYGVQSAKVDSTSTVYFLGAPPGEFCWKVLVKHPRKSDFLYTLRIKNKAVSTSGDYGQVFFEKGRKYTHILNPRTGQPISRVASVTVIADSAAVSDALSTALFVLGRAGLPLLKAFPGTEALILEEKGDQGKLTPSFSPGFKRFLVKYTKGD